jgi:NADPH-dependent 2,4-dienoyl-CoA reductase/sulfur reductase-like enzyme
MVAEVASLTEDIVQVDVVVVGAGPAGIAAASEAAKIGLDVLAVDRYAIPGGHYFKDFRHDSHYWTRGSGQHDLKEAASLFQELERSGAKLLTGSELWAAVSDASKVDSTHFEVYVADQDRSTCIHTRCVILAQGAYDRPVPFPGWTLPGVMTAGSAQVLLKSHGILPGQRVLLAGTGPLLLALASQLLEFGADLAAVLELAPRFAGWERLLIPAFGQWHRLAEGWRYLRALIRNGVSYRFGSTIFRAEGQSQVETAIVGRVNAKGQPRQGTGERVAVDAICLGFGFVPMSDAARLLGCRLRYSEHLGAHAVEHNPWMRTSVPGVLVAGDSADVNGKNVAILEGRLAALSAARDLGSLNNSECDRETQDIRARLVRERRFSRALAGVFPFRSGLWELATDDTEICRCEEVTVGDVRRAIRDGVVTLNALRGATRIGMGRCQGRYCEMTAAHLLAEMASQPIEATGIFTPRVPLVPVRARALCNHADELPI